MNKFEYKRVEVRTVKDIQRAEALQRQGWKIIKSGLFTILFERAKS
jgi:very-short-patch-repair endonuclease